MQGQLSYSVIDKHNKSSAASKLFLNRSYQEREGLNFPLKKLKTVAAEEFRHKILSDEFLVSFLPSLNLNFGSEWNIFY